MKPYSNDFRWKIIETYQAGEGTMRELARRFRVSLGFIRDLWKRYRQSGDVSPKAQDRGPKPRIRGADLIMLQEWVRCRPDATLEELRQDFARLSGIEVSVSTIGKALQRLGITRKKKTRQPSERTEDETIEHQRADFGDWQQQVATPRLHVVDEAGVNQAMTRRYARAPAGERAMGAVPVNPGPNLSVIGSVTTAGLSSMMLIEGAVNGEIFCTYVEHFLAPVLQPGDVVLMDNLPAHRVAGIEEAIHAAGATLRYLPPYSPDLSPMELAWSKIKEHLRSAAARTVEGVENALADAADQITKNDAIGWFKHCGFCVNET